MKPSIKTMRVVIFQEGEWLCAQVLEYDLAVQAKSLSSAYRRLRRMLEGHIAFPVGHRKIRIPRPEVRVAGPLAA